MRGQKLYQVEKILARRLNKKTNEYEYKIKWMGYSLQESTWEPLKSLQLSKNLVEVFDKKLEQQREKQEQVQKYKKRGRPKKNLINRIERETIKIVSTKLKEKDNNVSIDWRYFASKLISQEIYLIESLIHDNHTKKQKELQNIRIELQNIQAKILKNKVDDLENLQAMIFLTQLKENFTLSQIKKKTPTLKTSKKVRQDDLEIEILNEEEEDYEQATEQLEEQDFEQPSQQKLIKVKKKITKQKFPSRKKKSQVLLVNKSKTKFNIIGKRK